MPGLLQTGVVLGWGVAGGAAMLQHRNKKIAGEEIGGYETMWGKTVNNE